MDKYLFRDNDIHKALKKNYAYEAFPWADIESKSLTVSGLINHRHVGKERKLWARVLLGTDDQLMPLMRACVPSDPCQGIPPQAREDYAKSLLWDVEGAVQAKAVESWYNWSIGYKACYSAHPREQGGE